MKFHPVKLASIQQALSNGRMSRLSYAAWCIVGLIIYFLVRFLLVALGVSSVGMGYGVLIVFKYLTLISLPYINYESYSLLAVCLGAVSYSILVIFFAVLSIFRLHDLSKSGWWATLNFIPLVNIIFGLYIFIAKGKTAANQYGLPRLPLRWEKVMGWIYIVLFPFSILLIVAAVSILGYQKYIEHAKTAQESSYSQSMDNTSYTPPISSSARSTTH